VKIAKVGGAPGVGYHKSRLRRIWISTSCYIVPSSTLYLYLSTYHLYSTMINGKYHINAHHLYHALPLIYFATPQDNSLMMSNPPSSTKLQNSNNLLINHTSINSGAQTPTINQSASKHHFGSAYQSMSYFLLSINHEDLQPFRLMGLWRGGYSRCFEAIPRR
jgi:hypothetical protein